MLYEMPKIIFCKKIDKNFIKIKEKDPRVYLLFPIEPPFFNS